MEDPDHLHHWPAIGAHLGIKPDAARHLSRTQGLPTYRLGKTVCASKKALSEWLASRRDAAGSPAAA